MIFAQTHFLGDESNTTFESTGEKAITKFETFVQRQRRWWRRQFTSVMAAAEIEAKWKRLRGWAITDAMMRGKWKRWKHIFYSLDNHKIQMRIGMQLNLWRCCWCLAESNWIWQNKISKADYWNGSNSIKQRNLMAE